MDGLTEVLEPFRQRMDVIDFDNLPSYPLEDVTSTVVSYYIEQKNLCSQENAHMSFQRNNV